MNNIEKIVVEVIEILIDAECHLTDPVEHNALIIE